MVGNKIDLEDKRVLETKEAENFAKEKGFLFYEVSAKTGQGIQELFENQIFPEMARKFKLGDEEEVNNGQNENQKGVKLDAANSDKKVKKKGCCGGGKSKKNKDDVQQSAPDQGNEEEKQ